MEDRRFDALRSDPQYRLRRSKEQAVHDPRFQGAFTDKEFRTKASVDRHGRKIKPDIPRKSPHLEKKRVHKVKSKLAKKTGPEVVGSSDEDEDEEEEHGLDEKWLEKRDLAREGFSGSSSSEESSSEEESESEADLETAGLSQDEEIPMGEVTRRIGVVNLDWDNIRAVDIMSVAQSFAPSDGRIASVTIFPSEFGRERVQREELEGPPKEIFAISEGKAESEDEDQDEQSSEDDEKIKKRLMENQTSDGAEFDTVKLRKYQLERLRYYYAVIECDKKTTGKALYDAMDGREYLTTSNFFDLRFIPDDTSFDEDTPFDECFEVPRGYRPNDFRTEALTHSKVRLTWDDDDRTRKEVQKRAFSRAEIDENDMQAYIGSDDSDADSVASRMSVAEKRKAAKKAEQKEKMRAALGLGPDAEKSSKQEKDEPMGNMQITFTSGLGGKDAGRSVFENGPQDEESIRERYIRKEKERQKRRKERRKAERNGTAVEENIEGEAQDVATNANTGDDAADPFDDPFFNDPASAAKAEQQAKKAERQKKRQAREAQDDAAKERRAELELLMAEDQDDAMRHFDMREIEKAKKAEKRKGKKGKKKGEDADAVRDEFKIDTEDPRFKSLYGDHEYAIDPTSSKFKGTEGTKALLEQVRKKRKHGEDVEEAEIGVKKVERDDLGGMVARLKKKGKR